MHFQVCFLFFFLFFFLSLSTTRTRQDGSVRWIPVERRRHFIWLIQQSCWTWRPPLGRLTSSTNRVNIVGSELLFVSLFLSIPDFFYFPPSRQNRLEKSQHQPKPDRIARTLTQNTRHDFPDGFRWTALWQSVFLGFPFPFFFFFPGSLYMAFYDRSSSSGSGASGFYQTLGRNKERKKEKSQQRCDSS